MKYFRYFAVLIVAVMASLLIQQSASAVFQGATTAPAPYIGKGVRDGGTLIVPTWAGPVKSADHATFWVGPKEIGWVYQAQEGTPVRWVLTREQLERWLGSDLRGPAKLVNQKTGEVIAQRVISYWG